MDTNTIVKLKGFAAPVEKKKNGEYKMKGGQNVYLCFSSDFLLPEADIWRAECWQMMKQRPDLHFIFLTKRIERFMECVPEDWGEGYENVTVGCTVENQERADERLSLFRSLPVRHKNIILQPMISAIDLDGYLDDVELVIVGGESDRNARPLNYDWVLSVREQCVKANVSFEFRQCGTHFIKDGKTYTLQVRDLCSQARKAGIGYEKRRKVSE